MYVGAVFVVDDILIAKVVLPFIQGLGEHTLDDFYGWLDDQGVRLGGRLFRRRKRRRGGAEGLVRDLREYVDKHPDEAARLTAAAIKDAAVRTDAEFLGVLLSFLVAVFEIVKTLNRPAVLPGFLTGTEHLAVIDVRTRNAGEELANPAVVSPQSGDPRIVLAGRNVPPLQAPPLLPRIWLVTATDEERLALEQRAVSSARYLGQFDDFMNYMKGRWLVTDITRREVWVQEPLITEFGIWVPAGGRVDKYKWAESPEGVIAMRDALVAAAGEQVASDKVWLDAFSQPLRERR